MRAGVIACLIAAFTAELVRAEMSKNAPPRDKSGYNLLNPTPDSLLRELNTDRPDKTESPYTVDAGHFQLEMDLLTYTREGNENEFAFAPINIKAGLFNNVDLQFIAQTHNIQRDRSGFGDLLVRLKVNLWGNDRGMVALGVMPFVKFPTNQHDLGNSAVEGGIILPLAIRLPHEFDLGTMFEIDCIRNADNSGYHEEFINSITLGHAIVGELSGYAEFFSSVSTERSAEWIGTFDVGFTYKLRSNVQLDAGLNVGLTPTAEDLNPFIGVSYRY